MTAKKTTKNIPSNSIYLVAPVEIAEIEETLGNKYFIYETVGDLLETHLSFLCSTDKVDGTPVYKVTIEQVGKLSYKELSIDPV